MQFSIRDKSSFYQKDSYIFIDSNNPDKLCTRCSSILYARQRHVCMSTYSPFLPISNRILLLYHMQKSPVFKKTFLSRYNIHCFMTKRTFKLRAKLFLRFVTGKKIRRHAFYVKCVF